jgi:acetylornithine deacetylase
MSTYPDKCLIRIERRTIPGETIEQVENEMKELLGVFPARPLDGDVRITFAQSPSDVSVDAPIVRALGDALRASNEEVHVEGMTAWTDAALLNEAEIPAICFGPGDISVAHAAVEYVPVAEIERATEVLARLAQTWCSGREPAWGS